MSRTNGTRKALLVGLMVILVASQIEATLFMLGGACLVTLNSATALVGGELDRRGLGDALDTIHDFCGNLVRYSFEGIAMGAAEVQLRALLRFVARAGIDLPNRLPELTRLIQQLADTLGEVNAQLDISYY